MRRRILLMNLSLLVAVMLLGSHLVSGWRAFEERNNLEGIMKEPAAPVAASGAEVQPPPAPRPMGDFQVIHDRNLFLQGRRPESAEQQAQAQPQAPVFPKKPVLNGVSTLGGKKRAFLTVFESASDAGKSQLVGVGDKVQEWVVSAIEDTTLTLQWNDQTEVIDMMDAPRPQQARAQAAVNVISVGSAAAAVETIKGGTVAKPEEKKGVEVVGVGQDVVQTPFGTFVRQNPPPAATPQRRPNP